MRRHLSLLLGSLVLGLSLLIAPAASWAYPFWAQQNYDSPREATGKIVCANCHLAKKLTQAEVPQSVLPDSVFTASVKIPYEDGLQEIGADGSDVGLQVGAVVMLPDGFTLAPQDRWTDEMKEQATQMILQATQLEIEYARDTMPRGVLGMNANMMEEYLQFIANRRLAQIGLPEQYPGVKNPFPWMSEIMDLKKEKNFFETRVTEYQTGGALSWD